ncbi:MAG: hypothetical protein ABIU84_01285 [Thermoanaerobaculia bacterium]
MAAFLLFMLCGTAETRAQVSVVQGSTSTADKYQRLTSPMTLSLKVNNLRGVRASKGFGFSDITKFQCEDVSITTLGLLVSEARDASRTYTFKGTLRVHSGVDQNVGLTFILMEGGKTVLMKIEEPKISAEAGEDERFTLRAKVSSAAAHGIDGAKDLSLQIIVSTKRD